jgi:uncharacterized protein (DUF4415 family)
MKDEYDLSKVTRAKKSFKSAKEIKVIKTLRLDLDVLQWLDDEGKKQGMGYQTFLNWFLRKSMDDHQSFEERLKKVEQAVFKKKA